MDDLGLTGGNSSEANSKAPSLSLEIDLDTDLNQRAQMTTDAFFSMNSGLHFHPEFVKCFYPSTGAESSRDSEDELELTARLNCFISGRLLANLMRSVSVSSGHAP